MIGGISILARIRTRLGNALMPKEIKASPFLWPSYNNGVVSWGMGNFNAYVNEGFNLNALIYAAIMYKVRAAAQVRLRAYNGDPDSPEVLPPNHPLSMLLARPNPYQSFAELHGLIIAYLNLAGNAYLYVDRDGSKNGVPKAVYPLRPDRVYIIPGEGTIRGFLYRPPMMSQAEGVPILPEDMIHIKFPNLGDDYEGMGYGLSPMSPLAQSADVDNNATKFIKLFFERGGMPVGILKYNIPLEFTQIQEIKQKWRDVYGGVGNWTDIGVVDSAADYQKLGQDFSKLGMDQMDARNESRILSPFGVPSILLGTKNGLDRATYSNYEEARKAFWEDTMAYELRLELDSFAHYLYGNSGEFVQWDKSEVPALKQNIQALTASAKSLFDMGVPASIAFSTVGIKIGELPAGDLAFFSGSVKPFNPDDPFPTPAPSPFAPAPIGEPAKPQKPAASSQNNEGAANAEDDTRKGSRQGQSKKDKTGKPKSDDEVHTAGPLDVTKAMQEVREIWTKSVDKGAVKQEPKYRKAARDLFAEDARHIEAIVAGAFKSAIQHKATVSWGSISTDVGEYLSKVSTAKWRKTFIPLIRGTVIDAGKTWAQYLGVQFDVRNLEAEQWFQDYTLEFAKPISATTEEGVKKVIGDAMADGLSVPDAQKKLKTLFKGYADYRVERIVRTETIRAYNAGSATQFKNWNVKEKQWSAADDARTRPTHASADGQTIAIDKSFTIGGYQMDYPGDASHGAPPGEFVNCRCAILPAGDLAKVGLSEEQTDVPEAISSSQGYSTIDPNSDEGSDFYNQWRDNISKLNQNEQDSLATYTRSGSGQMNQYLRTGREARVGQERTNELIKGVDSAFSNTPTTSKPLTVYRGSAWAAFGIDPASLPEGEYTAESVMGSFVGTTIKDKGYVSTTIVEGVTEKFSLSNIFMEINVPTGSQAIYLEPLTTAKGEYELLLASGSQFKITKIEGNKIFADLIQENK